MPLPALGQPVSSQALLAAKAREAVDALIGKRDPARVFNARFLSEVPPRKLAALARQLQADNGKIVAVEGVVATGAHSGSFRIRFARATATAHVTVAAEVPYKVSGFRIGEALPLADSVENIAADFAALPGHSSFAVVRLGDGPPSLVRSSHADERLAVGSTFKLWVLDALAQDIADGRRRWDEVVPLGPRSLPGGISQDWPAATPMTVETLAVLMISRSDNTATDTLIRLIGRDRIAVPSPPLLTTAEAFALKLGAPERRATYAAADEAGKRLLLEAIDAPAELTGADAGLLDGTPMAIDSAEWFASPGEVVAILDRLRRRSDPRLLPILGVTTALDEGLRHEFAYVGYKGGSEGGVLSLAWLLHDKNDRWFAVTASWNDPARRLDDAKLEALGQRLVRLVLRAP